MSGRMAACIPRAAGSGRSNCHAENLFRCAGCHVCRCNHRILRSHVDADAGVGMVVSSGLGLASWMALWLARLLLGSIGCLRCCSASRRRSASGRLCAAARRCPSGLGPAALERSLLGSRTLGMMHYFSQTQSARSLVRLLLVAALGLPAGCVYAPAPVSPPPAPIPIVEQVPPPPPGYYVWRPGHWRWNGYRYVWVRGHYVISQG
jgi:hypothetical protein